MAVMLALAYLQAREGEAPTRPAPASTYPAPTTLAPAPPADPAAPSLDALPDAARRAQVSRVIESMDRTGRPPSGVAQGGRRDGPRGVFDNAQRVLPVRPYRYYTETDVWPRGPGGRGPERLVFGREREVYYTGDHYRTFTRVR